MNELKLSDIMQGLPGVSSVEGANLHENCMVELHRYGHSSPTTLKVAYDHNIDMNIVWEDGFNNQLDRTYSDRQSSVERSAVCISILLALKLTDYTIVERSRKGTGFDYMLGYKDDVYYNPKARLETSGIGEETRHNTLQTRFEQKSRQTDISDSTNMPAYISIVELKTPQSIFKTKTPKR
ncbi:MAG: hypothetical protein K6F33_03180 [Bacteroidales bacterium]|nr:hypothetical protein [Bacteroidales bacterium]